jgi:hypothetical protein
MASKELIRGLKLETSYAHWMRIEFFHSHTMYVYAGKFIYRTMKCFYTIFVFVIFLLAKNQHIFFAACSCHLQFNCYGFKHSHYVLWLVVFVVDKFLSSFRTESINTHAKIVRALAIFILLLFCVVNFILLNKNEKHVAVSKNCAHIIISIMLSV